MFLFDKNGNRAFNLGYGYTVKVVFLLALSKDMHVKKQTKIHTISAVYIEHETVIRHKSNTQDIGHFATKPVFSETQTSLLSYRD